MSKSTPLNQLPFSAQQQAPPPPMQVPQMQVPPMQQPSPQQPQMLPQYAMATPMPTQSTHPAQPTNFTMPQSTQPQADVLDDDATVNDVLKQINGSFAPQQQQQVAGGVAQQQMYMPPPSQVPTHIPMQQQPVFDTLTDSLVMAGDVSTGVSDADVGAASAPLGIAQPLSGDGVSWAEVLRVAIIVVILYIAIECMPISTILAQYVPALSTVPYGVLLIKALLLGACYTAAVKFI